MKTPRLAGRGAEGENNTVEAERLLTPSRPALQQLPDCPPAWRSLGTVLAKVVNGPGVPST